MIKSRHSEFVVYYDEAISELFKRGFIRARM